MLLILSHNLCKILTIKNSLFRAVLFLKTIIILGVFLMRKVSVLLITLCLLLVGCVGNAESLKNDNDFRGVFDEKS